MQRKHLSTFLLALLCTLHSYGYGFRVDGICYNLLSNGTVEVTYLGTNSTNNYTDLEDTDVIIPAVVTYGGADLTVVRIGDSAFKYAQNITSIELPNTITEIEKNAFFSCTNLSEVKLSNSLVSIGNSAFSYTKIEHIDLPNTLISIGNSAFSYCRKLESISFPNSISSIGEDVMSNCTSLSYAKLPATITSVPIGIFMNCTSLTQLSDIIIPNTVQSIGARAFYQCSNMTNAIIPQTVRAINERAFGNCSKLTSISLPDQLATIGAGGFEGCGFETILLPDQITQIDGAAFQYCHALRSIALPDKITTLNEYLFRDCNNLKSIGIPDGVRSIGVQVFSGCSSLENISLSDSITSFSAGVFQSCTSLKSVHLPKGITSIPNYTFYMCKALTDVDFPQKIYTIGERAFQECEALKNVDGLFDNVTKIDSHAFFGCKSLLNINIQNGTIYNYAFGGCSNMRKLTIGKGVTYIGYFAFQNCSNLDSVNIYFPDELPEPPLAVPSTLTIDQGAFQSSLIKCVNTNSLEYWCKINFNHAYSNPIRHSRSLSLNNEVVKDLHIGFGPASISAYAFYYCDSLESVRIDDGVKSIGNQAFYGCSNLKQIDIPSTVTQIGEKVFTNTGLNKVLSRIQSPPSVDLGLTDIQYVTIPLYVPEGSESDYAEKSSWNKFARIYTFGEPQQVTVGRGTDVTKQSFMANWGGASAASFDLYVYKERETVRESFDNATIADLKSKGWQFGEKVACDEGAIRLGTSSVGGEISTPLIGVFSGNASLSFDIKAYPNNKDVGKTVDITLEGGGSSSITSITVGEDYTNYIITLNDVTENTKVRLSSHEAANNRFYIDNVIIATLGTSTTLSKASLEENFDNETVSVEQLESDGWELVKGFVEDSALRLGTSSVGGEVITPPLGTKRNAVMNIDIKAYPNAKDIGKTIDISVVGNGSVDITEITTTAEYQTYTLRLSDINEETRIKLASHQPANNRFFIDNVSVVSGKAVWRLIDGYPVNTTEYSYNVTGLEQESTYSYYVIAKNEIGDEAEVSNVQSVSTLPGSQTARGDINGDQSIDGADVSALLEMVLAGGLTDDQEAVADLTGDGSIDGSDVSALLEIVLSGE